MQEDFDLKIKAHNLEHEKSHKELEKKLEELGCEHSKVVSDMDLVSKDSKSEVLKI